MLKRGSAHAAKEILRDAEEGCLEGGWRGRQITGAKGILKRNAKAMREMDG